MAVAFILLGYDLCCAGQTTSPAQNETGLAAGWELVQRWSQVQGLDRPKQEIYPREAFYELEIGDPVVTVKLHIKWAEDSCYWMESTHPTAGKSVELSVRIQGGSSLPYLVSDTLGVGFTERSPLAATLRLEAQNGSDSRRRFPEVFRLPDETIGGKLLHVTLARENGGAVEKWFFDPVTGARVRTEARIGLGPNDFETADFTEFFSVDEFLEAGCVTFHGPSINGKLKLSSASNRVEMPPGQFTLPPAVDKSYLDAITILQRYRKACGGDSALSQTRSRVTRAHGEVTTSGVKFRMIMSQKLPNRVLTEIDADGIGRSLQGYDGSKGWASSELMGFRALRGTELRAFLSGADLHEVMQLEQQNPMRKFLGIKQVGGRPAKVLALGTTQVRRGVYYFDDETGRLVRVESVIANGPENVLPVTLDFSDFRVIDGMTLPFVTTVTNPAMRVVTTIDSVENNVPLDDSIFKPRQDG